MANLAELLARVRAVMMDGSSLVWSDADLTEGLRLAVGEYSLAGDAVVTVEGLDGAAVSTLGEVHESLIVWGASAYAASSRAVDRAEAFQLGGEAGQLKAWGDARLKEFKAMLGAVFPGYLVVLAGSSGSSGSDPALTAAQAALYGAQAELASAQAAHVDGEESRAAAAAVQAAADRAAEAARLAELRSSTASPWGTWTNTAGIEYPADYERS